MHIRRGNFLSSWVTVRFSRRSLLHGVSLLVGWLVSYLVGQLVSWLLQMTDLIFSVVYSDQRSVVMNCENSRRSVVGMAACLWVVKTSTWIKNGSLLPDNIDANGVRRVTHPHTHTHLTIKNIKYVISCSNGFHLEVLKTKTRLICKWKLKSRVATTIGTRGAYLQRPVQSFQQK